MLKLADAIMRINKVQKAVKMERILLKEGQGDILKQYGLSYKLYKHKGGLKWEPSCITANTLFQGKNFLGAMTYMQSGAKVSSIHVGRFTCIGGALIAGGGRHPMDMLSTHPFAYNGTKGFAYDEYFKKIVADRPEVLNRDITYIGNDVWIGQGVYLAQGVKIGDGAVIGARSVVTKDVAPYSIVAGSPAKLIRMRFDKDIVNKLLEATWWNYDISPIRDEMDYSNVRQCCDVLLEAKKDLKLFKPLRYSVNREGKELCLYVPPGHKSVWPVKKENAA